MSAASVELTIGRAPNPEGLCKNRLHPWDESNVKFYKGTFRCMACRAVTERTSPERNRKARLKRMYSMTPEQFSLMLERAENCCESCGDPFTEERKPHIDHDHACCPTRISCGECVRGVLCGPCNQGMGNFKDDAERLLKAVEYLEHRNG